MLAQLLTQPEPSPAHTRKPNLLPVVRELPADLETPVSIYLKLSGGGPSFLLESVSGGEQVARYSFIGIQPSQAYVIRPGVLERTCPRVETLRPSRRRSTEPAQDE
jgi:anthranilate synthase component 1